MMTKKDYELIAAALLRERPIADEGRLWQHRHDCMGIADALQATRAEFDRTRFLRACGVDVVNG